MCGLQRENVCIGKVMKNISYVKESYKNILGFVKLRGLIRGLDCPGMEFYCKRGEVHKRGECVPFLKYF